MGAAVDMGQGVTPSGAPVNAAAAEPKGAIYHFAIAAIVVLTTLILIALAAAAYAVLFRTKPKAPSVEVPLAAPDLTLPARSAIQTLEVSGDRLIVHLHTDRGDEIDIIDTRNGHLVARILTALPPGAPAPQ